MKTTVELPDALYRDVRAWAAQHGWTVRIVLEESLRQFLGKQQAGGAAGAPAWRPVVFDGEGLQTPGMTFREMLEATERPFPGTRGDG